MKFQMNHSIFRTVWAMKKSIIDFQLKKVKTRKYKTKTVLNSRISFAWE